MRTINNGFKQEIEENIINLSSHSPFKAKFVIKVYYYSMRLVIQKRSKCPPLPNFLELEKPTYILRDQFDFKTVFLFGEKNDAYLKLNNMGFRRMPTTLVYHYHQSPRYIATNELASVNHNED